MVWPRLSRLERAMGWSEKWGARTRAIYARMARRAAIVPSGPVNPAMWCHVVFRDGLLSTDAYISNRLARYPEKELAEIGHLLTHGREIGGAPLVYDVRNVLRVCQFLSLVYSLYYEGSRWRPRMQSTSAPR